MRVKFLMIILLISMILMNGCVEEKIEQEVTTTLATTSTTSITTTTSTIVTTTSPITTTIPITSKLENIGLSEIKIPAVDGEGKGVIINLQVEAIPGHGRALTDIENLLFWVDTQHSIRTARRIACNISQVNISQLDLIYTIYANASIVGGESAGAAITIATIAAIKNKNINKSVIITGRINHDGTIGPVSAIIEKAKAAKEANATLFLVPLLQSREVIYETKEHCERIGWGEFCTREQIPKKINVEDEVGIKVREVGSIREAMGYFFQ